MFDESHYVPILRWKRGEGGALKLLSDEEKLRLTPLIEFPTGMFSSSGSGNDFLGALIRAI